MLGKTFKGMTDDMLRWQTEQLLALEISRDSYTVFVEPKIVVEIAYSDIQTSSRYKSGFCAAARVKRYRTDKTAAEADTLETVRRQRHRRHLFRSRFGTKARKQYGLSTMM